MGVSDFFDCGAGGIFNSQTFSKIDDGIVPSPRGFDQVTGVSCHRNAPSLSVNCTISTTFTDKKLLDVKGISHVTSPEDKRHHFSTSFFLVTNDQRGHFYFSKNLDHPFRNYEEENFDRIEELRKLHSFFHDPSQEDIRASVADGPSLPLVGIGLLILAGAALRFRQKRQWQNWTSFKERIRDMRQKVARGEGLESKDELLLKRYDRVAKFFGSNRN